MSGLLDDIGLEPGAPLRLGLIPTISVALASAVAALPIVTNAPMLPPLGFMLFIAWRLLRSDIWPVWIGIPLGFWDDLVSGQPVGSAVALWTIVMLAMDIFDRRVIWRDFWIDWVIAGAALLFVLLFGGLLAAAGSLADVVRLIAPQYLWSLLLLPLAMLFAARLDRWRIGT